MGIWGLLGRIIKLSAKESVFVSDRRQGVGRILYEHFDDSVRAPSAKSRFFILKSARMFDRKGEEGPEVLGRIEVDISNSEMVEELLDTSE